MLYLDRSTLSLPIPSSPNQNGDLSRGDQELDLGPHGPAMTLALPDEPPEQPGGSGKW